VLSGVGDTRGARIRSREVSLGHERRLINGSATGNACREIDHDDRSGALERSPRNGVIRPPVRHETL